MNGYVVQIFTYLGLSESDSIIRLVYHDVRSKHSHLGTVALEAQRLFVDQVGCERPCFFLASHFYRTRPQSRPLDLQMNPFMYKGMALLGTSLVAPPPAYPISYS